MVFASLIQKDDAGRMSCPSCWPGLVQVVYALLSCGLLAAASGCSLLPVCSSCSTTKETPPLPVTDVLVYWDNRVRITSDSVNNGRPLHGLAGRVHLFNTASKHTVDADGKMVIELYNMTPVAAGGHPQRLADWTFDTESLRQLKRRCAIGDGYTLFLPWETYRPDITQIKLQLAYVPHDGSPYYTDPMTMTLRPDEPLTIQTQNREVTPAPNPPPAQQQPTAAKK
jgi:hypothetical protein